MAFTSSTAQLGEAEALKYNLPVNRDATRILEGISRRGYEEQKAKKEAKEKLVTLKDFKFNDGLLPAFSGYEARKYAEYANELGEAIDKHGVGNAVNIMSTKRNRLLQELANNKAANDSWQQLIENKKAGKIVPGLDEGSDIILNKDAFDDPTNFTKLNNDIMGVSVAPNGFVITNVYDDPEKILNATAEKFNDNRMFDPTNPDPTKRVGKVMAEYPKGNEKVQQQWWEHPQANRDYMNKMILSDQNIAVPLLETHKAYLNSPDGKKLYPNIYSSNADLRKADMELFAQDITNSKLVGKQVEQKYPIVRETEADKKRDWNVSGNRVYNDKNSWTYSVNDKTGVQTWTFDKTDPVAAESKLRVFTDFDGKQVEGIPKGYIDYADKKNPYLIIDVKKKNGKYERKEIPYSEENVGTIKNEYGFTPIEVVEKLGKKGGTLRSGGGSSSYKSSGGSESKSGFQEFTVKGKKYRVPSNEADAFKKDMGL